MAPRADPRLVLCCGKLAQGQCCTARSRPCASVVSWRRPKVGGALLEAGVDYGVYGAVGPESKVGSRCLHSHKTDTGSVQEDLDTPSTDHNAQSNKERPTHGNEIGSVEEDGDKHNTDHTPSDNKERL